MYPGVSPHLLETLLAGMPAFLFSLRRSDLALLWISEGAGGITGFDSRDLLARPGLFAERLPPEERENLVRLCGDVSDSSFVREDFRFRCADGKVRWFRTCLGPALGPPGDLLAVAGIAWPIDDVKSASRQARLGQDILLAARTPIVFTDMGGRIRLWNGAAERFFGWSAGEMVGSAIQGLFTLPPEVVEGMIRRVHEEGMVSREDRLATKHGRPVPCRVTVSLVRDEGGAGAGMVAAVAGTAEFRGLESRLQEAITRLRIIERVNRITASEWDIRKAHGRIATELEKLVDFDRTSLCFFEEGKDSVLIHAHAKGETALGSGTSIPLDGSAPGWVLARRITRIDEDMAAADERFAEDEILVREGMRSRLMIPLFVGERIVGTLDFNGRRKGAYSLATVEELGSIPDQLALAIDKYQTYVRLSSSEEKYRLLFELGPPAAISGPDGRFVDVNEGCLRMLGYTREEFLRLTNADLDSDPDQATRPARVLDSGQALEKEALFRRKDGSLFWGHVNIFPVSKNLVLGQITDISPRKDAEEALRREKEFSSSILSVANALIVVFDRSGRILLFNRKCEEVTGWTEREIRGRRLWDDLLPEPFIGPIKAKFARLDREDIPPSFENPWVSREGKERLIIWNNSVVRDERGEVIWVIGAGIDVTEQRELEEQLRHAQKMEAVGTLAGGIAHDFNNIIQAIMGYTSLLKTRAGGQVEAAEQVEAIERASLRAAELTSQLLGFARRGKYEARPTDLNGVVEKVVSMIRPTFDRSIKIRTELCAGLNTVEGDAGQLEHTLLNLCINARDAMPEGGSLRIATGNETLLAKGAAGPAEVPAGEYVILSVSDTGVGISPDSLPRIFEPFYTTKEPGKGTGMGLAMVYGIVKNHEGWIDVRSEVDRGTTFRIMLPASRRVPAAVSPPPRREDLVGGTETILFVDDEESLRLLAVEMLGGLGYTVLTARNGVEALILFSEKRSEIALVILDLIMPEMGGVETSQKLREMDPSARILVSSGYAVEGRPEDMLAEGAAGFIRKPYRLADLASAVRRALGGGVS
ncbi:MAG: PAS domain S-box protein [Deltaproteobacteria bacterium]|nr:PAS domain S-box protein [Deltaproteobacteria bacterium]